ncbi:hypothetical protein HanPSC8_Chr02g0054411 [Helianthus annuus]|nr:hypothetical protein HanPSC8_Chr02g0054411 [Helianthus annuus]
MLIEDAFYTHFRNIIAIYLDRLQGSNNRHENHNPRGAISDRHIGDVAHRFSTGAHKEYTELSAVEGLAKYTKLIWEIADQLPSKSS